MRTGDDVFLINVATERYLVSMCDDDDDDVCACACACACVHACVRAYVCVHVHVCVCKRLNVCMCVRVHAFVISCFYGYSRPITTRRTRYE